MLGPAYQISCLNSIIFSFLSLLVGMALCFKVDELICISLISNVINIFLQGWLLYFSLYKLFVSIIIY